MSLYVDDMITTNKNPSDSTQKLLDLISQFNQVSGYKIKIQKSVGFLYGGGGGGLVAK